MDVKQALETIISALPNKHAFTEEIKTLEEAIKELEKLKPKKTSRVIRIEWEA